MVIDLLESPNLTELSESDPYVFLVHSDSEAAWQKSLQQIRHQFPHSVLILIDGKNQVGNSFSAILHKIEFVVTPGLSASLDELIQRAAEIAVERLRLEGIFRSSSQQFREIERHQESLQREAEDRAVHIRATEVEEEFRLRRVRQLIHWIRELSHSTGLEEVLLLLRSELKPMHSIVDAFFLMELEPGRILFHRIARGQSLESKVTAAVTTSQTHNQSLAMPKSANTFLDVEWSQLAADICGRPVGRLLPVVLSTPLIRKLGFPTAQVQLLIESTFNAREAKAFFEDQRERLKSLSITVDRILLEGELTRYSYRWEKTFDGLVEPLAIIDREDQLVRSNLAFSDRTRQGKCFDLFQGKSERCQGCPVPLVAQTNASAISEVKKGERVFEVHSYPIFLGRKDQASNYVNLYVDVTNKRELTQKFIQNEKMSALGLLAGHIAHELNNPLTGLRSMAQLLAAEMKHEPQMMADFLEIEKAAARSEKVIRHLLEFADLEGKNEEWIELEEVVQRTLPLMKMTTRNHRMNFRMQAPARKVYVQVHLLQQVIFNMVTNACQAMSKSGTLLIETGVGPGAHEVYVKVEDNGPGIPPEIQKKIFEPFFTTKKEGEGTGLGLSLSRDIVQRAKGRIELKSAIGEGTTFTIILPGDQ